ncbi:MAG TPA: glycosyltransferase family 2 protein [Candidatus Binatia bacterium]|jgi:dolichol-phosphate mannosyltransferase
METKPRISRAKEPPVITAAFQHSHPLRAIARLLNLPVGARVQVSDTPRPDRATIILPVLNESPRISACLDSLVAQPQEAAEILVVDGGSTDGTQEIVKRYQDRDERVRLIDASPMEPGWTGKSWGLHVGLQASAENSRWILCVDADVRASPQLMRSLLAHAARTGVETFSLATTQRLSGAAEALIHPPLLTTLIYRFGIPGKATKQIHKALANGQCFISRRETLLRSGAFLAARSSLCEDITIVRRLAECGEAIGFYEGQGLMEVRMYDDWRETWRNWPRSLPMRDQYFGWHEWLGLVKVLLFQALPLPVFLLCAISDRFSFLAFATGALSLLRLGLLAGTARAYKPRPWSYWLSPLLDLPAAVKLFASALARRHVWRGKIYLRRNGGTFEPIDNCPPAERPIS